MSLDKQIIQQYATSAALQLGAGDDELQNHMLGLCTDTKELLYRIGATFYHLGGSAAILTAGSVMFAGTGGIYSQDNSNFFFDDTNNFLGVGTATPAAKGHFCQSTTGYSFESNAGLIVEENDHCAIQLTSLNTKSCAIYFGDNDSDVCSLYYSHTTNFLTVTAGAATVAYFGASYVGIASTIPLWLPDNTPIRFGGAVAVNDGVIYSDGTNRIDVWMNSTTGTTVATDGTIISMSGTNWYVSNREQGRVDLKAVNGAVGLWTAGVNRLEVALTGTITVSSLTASKTVFTTAAKILTSTSPITDAYTTTNVTPDRSFDADTAADAELADVLGTLIADLKTAGILV